MFAASAPFAAMVEGVDQRVEWLLTLALTDAAGNPVAEDVNLALESCRVEAQAQTDVPDQMRLQSGFPTIAANFTLSGYVDPDDTSKTAAWLFGRYSTDSPLWRVDAIMGAVTISLGLLPDGAGGTPELIRKFTGWVDTYTKNVDGTVSFDCVDNATMLRSVPSLPGVLNLAPYRAGLTNEYAADALLRAATAGTRLGVVSSWPAQRDQAVFAAGMRGSMWAEVGQLRPAPPIDANPTASTLAKLTQPTPSFTPGVFGSALVLPDSNDPDVSSSAGFQRATWLLDGPAAPPPATPNDLGTITAPDNFADAYPLTSGVRVETATAGATTETGEPFEGFWAHTVWFKWVAPRNDRYTFSVAESDYPASMVLYTLPPGTSGVAALTVVTSTAQTIRADLTAGTTYYVYAGASTSDSPTSGRLVLDFPDPTVVGPVGSEMFVEFWTQGVHGTSDPSVHLTLSGTGDAQVDVEVFADRITASCNSGTHTWTTAVSSGGHYVGVQLHWPLAGSAFTGTMWLDGASHTIPSTSTGSGRGRSIFTTLWASKSNGVAHPTTIEAWHVTTETSPTPSYPFVPTAFLDPSLNPMDGMPDLGVDIDVTAALQQLAGSEFALAGFDEAGVFRYRNRESLISASVRSITSAASLLALSEESTAAAVINDATVEYAIASYSPNQSVGGGPGDNELWHVRPYQTITRYVVFPDPVAVLDTAVKVLPDNGGGGSWYRASADRNGLTEHPGLDITAALVSPLRARVTIHNGTPVPAFLVNPANYTDGYAVGQPMLQLNSYATYKLASTSQTSYRYPKNPARSRFGRQSWSLSGNQFVQDVDTAEGLAQRVVVDSYKPRPNLTNVAVVPDPRLQLADTVLLSDPDVTGVNEYARVYGWTLELSAGGWDMTIDARTVAAPGAWILGVPGRSELGLTTFISG